MEWNKEPDAAHQHHFEKAFIYGDYEAVERVLEEGRDTGCVFPCLLMFDAAKIGRYNTVRLLLANYKTECCAESTLTQAMRDAIVFHDVRQLSNWNGYVTDDRLVQSASSHDHWHDCHGDCRCERPAIIDVLLSNGASRDNLSSLFEKFLLTSPIVCTAALNKTIAVLLDHGCDLSGVVEQFVTCSYLYLTSPTSLMTLMSLLYFTAQRFATAIENILPILIYHEDRESIVKLHQFGYAISRAERELVRTSHPSIVPKADSLQDVLNLHDTPCTLMSLCRRNIYKSLRNEHRNNNSQSTSRLIGNLNYPKILKEYLTFRCIN